MEHEAGRRDGWAIHSNPHPGRVISRPLRQKGGMGPHRLNSVLGPNPGPTPNNPGTKGRSTVQKKRGPQNKLVQALSNPNYAGVEGRTNPDVEKEGEEVTEIEPSQLLLESQRLEAPLVDPDLLNRFEISTPIVNSLSLSVFGRPLFQGGSSSLGVLHILREEEEGVLPLAIVVENEVKGGTDQEGMMVEFGQEEGFVEATPLAVEGYESWEDSMLVKFSKFLGFATVGFETQIVDLMRQMLKIQSQGLRSGQTPVARCERELKKLECTINYGGQRSGKSVNRDRGNLLLKLG